MIDEYHIAVELVENQQHDKHIGKNDSKVKNRFVYYETLLVHSIASPMYTISLILRPPSRKKHRIRTFQRSRSFRNDVKRRWRRRYYKTGDAHGESRRKSEARFRSAIYQRESAEEHDGTQINFCKSHEKRKSVPERSWGRRRDSASIDSSGRKQTCQND